MYILPALANMASFISGSNTEIYTPLTCELCTETFTIPADWVKHVQTHTDMLPAKRRRRDSPDVSFNLFKQNNYFPIYVTAFRIRFSWYFMC